MARFLAVALALLAGCDAEPYRVRFHLQLDAGRPVEDGAFVLTVHPEWAPLGEARFRELLREKFFDGARFFRVVPDFVVQWGLPASSETAALWEERTITDDPVLASNTRGRVSFATSGPDTRTTQLFVNTRTTGNARLDGLGFSPFGEIDATGMTLVDRIYSGAGEEPEQSRIADEGNTYLLTNFPELSWIRSIELCGTVCTVEGRIQHSGILRVGSPFDYPPFSARNSSGHPVGAEVDLVRAMAAQLGCRIAWVQSSWRTLLPDLLADRFDLAFGGVSITRERALAANFSRPLLEDGKVLVFRCAETERYSALSDQLRTALDGASDEDLYSPAAAAFIAAWRRRYAPRVVVNPGGTNERSVRAWFALDAPSDEDGAKLMMVSENGDQFGAISRGVGDVTITDRAEAVYRTAAEHQEQGAPLCATNELLGPASHKALLLPAANSANGQRQAARDDGSWVRRIDAMIDAAVVAGWEDATAVSHATDFAASTAADAVVPRLEPTSQETSTSTLVLPLLGVLVVGALLTQRSVRAYCCQGRRSSTKHYAGLREDDEVT